MDGPALVEGSNPVVRSYLPAMMPIVLLSLALPGPDAAWETLLNKPVHVECTTSSGQPFCRSTAVFEAEPKVLRETLGSMADHHDKFESIVSVRKLGDDTMHVVMDFPWPLADRDYVARYTQTDGADGSMVLSWVSATHPEAPDDGTHVRLTEFTGSWTLTPLDGGKTQVVYLWHGEYGGALPDAALTTARKKTGQEALKDLAKAAGGLTYSGPS